VFDVCRFNVTHQSSEPLVAPPPVLSRIERYQLAHAVNASSPRRWDVSFDSTHGHFLINGRMFEMQGVAENEIVRANTLEVIEFHNPSTFPSMPHPIHLHGRQFQILDRVLESGSVSDYNDVRAGFLDEGWKDTFILWPGERVRILVRYTRHPGLYVYHCHNLEHEDMHMMRNFLVVP
jgi:FtsP/CotA-like multicopper oxidase with cupredoxin domain